MKTYCITYSKRVLVDATNEEEAKELFWDGVYDELSILEEYIEDIEETDDY